eukprot:CAMPEP_0194425394 /NCGR_PEP_ID=MMETSP0176-20130528/24733_1 /TAXON_ID=216777 /ORGANISM="Proboscia alata, Strain PI-D3" /LENGTH=466 /DNA_ID=CAMNT_0039235739 /DNA_START=163 /DNA_END=1566 /DNA_ORIENTATION=-
MNIPYQSPPSVYSHADYCQDELHRRQVENTTVYGTVFSPDGGRYLVACSSIGMICCWDMNGEDRSEDEKDASEETKVDSSTSAHKRRRTIGCLSEGYWGNNKKRHRNDGRPILRVQVPGITSQTKSRTLYDIKFVRLSNDNHHLIVSGDVGIIVYRWSDFLNHLSTEQTTTKMITIEPVATFHPHPSVSEQSWSSVEAAGGSKHGTGHAEINSAEIDTELNVLYGASGDLFGCYQWDLETQKLLTTLPCSDYLHTVRTVPSTNGGCGNHTVLTGGEDGKLGIWDGKNGKLIEKMDVRLTMDANASLITSDTHNRNNGNVCWGQSSNLWLSNIDVDECGNWAVVCGGAENGSNGTPATAATPSNNGFLTLWNLPTRSMTSGHATRETLQSVRYNTHNGTILTVGNEPYLSYWSYSKANRVGRTRLNVPSGFAIALNDVNGVICVGGSSCFVDCLANEGNCAFSLPFS